MNYSLTYEDALKLCEAYKDFNFYKTEHMFGNFKAVTFNYFICDFNTFNKPIENSNINGFEMRGVTFVFNEDGSLFKRFLMLKKFFNVNQIEDTQHNVLKNKKIKYVTIKEDGSLVAFMNLPNGAVFAKTQAGFTNEQSLAAMRIYNSNKNIKKFVDEALESGFTPLFEYVSFDNRIVLKYAKEDLILIGVRDNKYETYFSAAELIANGKKIDISYVKPFYTKSIEELENIMNTSEDFEGVVVEFDDGQLVKWKTKWYWNAHQVRENVNRENIIIKLILENKIDDFLSTIDNTDYIKQINNIQIIINEYFIHKKEEIENLCKLYNGDKKNFAILYKTNKNFSLAIKYIIGNKDIKLIIADYLKLKTSKLLVARKFLNDKYI